MATTTFPSGLVQPKTLEDYALWCERWIVHLEAGPNDAWNCLWYWDEVDRLAKRFCVDGFYCSLTAPRTQKDCIRKLRSIAEHCRTRRPGAPSTNARDLAWLVEFEEGLGIQWETKADFARAKKEEASTMRKALRRAESLRGGGNE